MRPPVNTQLAGGVLVLRAIGRWPLRRWVVAIIGAAAAAVLIGTPTGLISTPYFTRMTAVLWWNYPTWIVTAILSGLALATYIRPAPGDASRGGGITGAGVLSAFAVGCPVCNKLVVAVMGLSGALNIWAPLQPIIGVGAIAVLGYALLRRVRGELACPLPAADATPAAVVSSFPVLRGCIADTRRPADLTSPQRATATALPSAPTASTPPVLTRDRCGIP